MQESDFIPLLSALVGSGIRRAERLRGGRNSHVYKLTCDDSQEYAAKLYLRSQFDERDRLGAEFAGLNFLWRQGVRRIPRPIAADTKHGWAVYEYVSGDRIASQNIDTDQIDTAIDFVNELKQCTCAQESRALGLAAEACFSVQAVSDNIQLRLQRLSERAPNSDALHRFLNLEFIPTVAKLSQWARSKCDNSAIGFTSELRPDFRTLSPSDFGFHNAIRRQDGQIIFLDFEYFGWDDPAKIVCDFLLHPAMQLSDELGRRFLMNLIRTFADDQTLAYRISILHPLFGLKWCSILLNEFLPEHAERLGIQSATPLERATVHDNQLAKARRMLARSVALASRVDSDFYVQK